MTSDPALQQQVSLPQAIRLVRYNPVRRPFSFETFDPSGVRTLTDLPPYLILGSLDPASFSTTPDGWSATYRGNEPDTRFHLSYRRDPGVWRVQQSWCGVDGGLSQAPARVPLGQIVSQLLYTRFPSAWDRAAKEILERDYQLHYVAQPENMASFCGIPDGAFRTIAVPVAVENLRSVGTWLEGLAAEAQLAHPLGAEAKLVFQAVNYLEGKAPEWTRSAPVVFDQSIADTGTVPLGLPVRETAPDGSAAWTLRRGVYLVLLTVPFAGLKAVLARLAGGSGPIRARSAAPLRNEQVPLVFPAGIELQAKEINVWDTARTTRSCWQFADPYGRPDEPGTDAIRLAERDADARLRAAEQISAAATAAARRLLGEAIEKAGAGSSTASATRSDTTRYIFYRDHIGWVITTARDYELLQGIHRAMRAETWGQFLDALPAEEQDRLLSEHEDWFGPDLLDDAEESPDPDGGLLSRDSPFDPGQLPGFDEGDYPFWPAADSSISDSVCREAYKRYGKSESGFVHSFHHLHEDQLEAVQAWLETLGHSAERRESPSV